MQETRIKGPLLLLIISLLSSGLLFGDITYRVLPGDTLFSIALKYNYTTTSLAEYNDLDSENIYPGMEIRIPRDEVHVVSTGETLSQIALIHGLTVDDIMEWNNLQNDMIYVGQELELEGSSIQLLRREYVVKEGDSLWSIAHTFSLELSQLRAENNLWDDRIMEGMILKLPVNASSGHQRAQIFFRRPNEHEEKGPYSNQLPQVNRQPSMTYSELSQNSIDRDFRQAQSILRNLDREIERAGLLSRDLQGWTVVIDPGHGGMDPGAIVETRDGSGNAAYVVEDEYSYDIALRLYSLIKQHGAQAELTILSPNHQIRTTPDASATLVNQKNEVFNSPGMTSRPRGGREGLRDRVSVIRELTGRNASRTLFISLHCDYSVNGDYDSALLYWGESEEEMESSRELAMSFQDNLGGVTAVRSQELAVLKNNPAVAAVLIEVRNLSSPDNSWILRKEELRNQEVERIFQGILDYGLSH